MRGVQWWRGATYLVVVLMLLSARPAGAQFLDSPVPCDGDFAALFCLADPEILLEIQAGDWTTCQDCCDVRCASICYTNFAEFETCQEQCYLDCFEAVLPLGAHSCGGEGELMHHPKVWPPESVTGELMLATRDRISRLLIQDGHAEEAGRYLAVCTLRDKWKTTGLTEPESAELVRIAGQSGLSLATSHALATLAIMTQRSQLPAALRPAARVAALQALSHAKPTVRGAGITLLAALDPEPDTARLQPLAHDANKKVAALAQSVLAQLRARDAS